MSVHEVFFEVAAFTIRIFTHEDAVIYVPEGYESFLVKSVEKADIEVEVKQGLPSDPILCKEVFRAYDTDEDKHSQKKLWNIVQCEKEQLIFTSEPYRNIYPYLAANFTMPSDKWIIYNSEQALMDGKNYLNPLAYPMGPLLLYHIALYNKAIMIHASGIDSGSEGYLFSGFSGVGKSTMGNLWHNKAGTMVNDDRLFIRKIDGNYYFFNTPMTYADVPKKALLNAVFLIKHHQGNKIAPINGLESITKLMAFCIQHHYNPAHVKLILDTVIDIAHNCDIYELGFVPDETVIDFINNIRKQ